MKLARIPLTSAASPGDKCTAPCCIVLKPWGSGWVTRCRNLQNNGEHGGSYFERHEFDTDDECYAAAHEHYLDRCASLGVSPGTISEQRIERDAAVMRGDLHAALCAATAFDRARGF